MDVPEFTAMDVARLIVMVSDLRLEDIEGFPPSMMSLYYKCVASVSEDGTDKEGYGLVLLDCTIDTSGFDDWEDAE